MKPQAATLAAAAALALTFAAHHTGERPTPPGPAIVNEPATPTPPPAALAEPSAITPGRAALRWQLAAEHGLRTQIPPGVFTDQLAHELARRPPATTPGLPRARVVRLRELKRAAGLRQLVATIRRGRHDEYVNVLLDCRRRCKVASIQ